MIPLVILVGAASAAESGQPCAAPASEEAWATTVARAETAFAARNEPSFDAAMSAAAADVPCLGAVISPALAARYHRLVGLRLYARGDAAGATLAFAAARAVDPFGALPSALLPLGHEARTLSTTASTAGETVHSTPVSRGELYFDGARTLERPADRPTLAQVEVRGQLFASQYLAPDDPLPAYPAANRHPTAHWVTGGAGVLLAAASAVCYGLALADADTLEGPLPAGQYARADVVALQSRANGLVVAAGATGALGVAAFAVTVARW